MSRDSTALISRVLGWSVLCGIAALKLFSVQVHSTSDLVVHVLRVHIYTTSPFGTITLSDTTNLSTYWGGLLVNINLVSLLV